MINEATGKRWHLDTLMCLDFNGGLEFEVYEPKTTTLHENDHKNPVSTTMARLIFQRCHVWKFDFSLVDWVCLSGIYGSLSKSGRLEYYISVVRFAN